MTNIAIIGSGFIGRAWAIAHARAGNEVHMWDQDPAAAEKGKAYIAALLPDLAASDLLNGNEPEDVLARITPVATLEAAVDGVAHVQENTFEQIDVKREVFRKLDAVTPADAVIASSTSALLPSTFTEDLPGRARCIVAHPINPPYLIPAAEVVPAPWTSEETVQRTAATLRAIGNAPIVMKREIGGFLMNRLQGALLEEAFRLVADGYASVEDVDIGLREGLALRWSFIGPFETIDLNAPGGIRDYIERYQGIYSGLGLNEKPRIDWAGPVMAEVEKARRDLVPAGDLQKRQEWRDRRLVALLAHKRAASREIGD